MIKIIKQFWKGFRLAYDPGYPLMTEFLQDVWSPRVLDKLNKHD